MCDKIDLIRAFIGGAIAFQMIASNWTLALIFRTPGALLVRREATASKLP